MFEKTLVDLIKGIRGNKEHEDEFIRKSLSEIKDEVRSTDMFIKAQAIQKLTYLNMTGYDMSWASFHVLEVMSYAVFALKRIGYLAAAQCFHEDTDVLMLTTQLLKKDLLSSNGYESCLAINCLSCIVTPDLGRDLVSDIVTLLNSQKHYVRKKAVLVLFKIFLSYPDALRPVFPRLKEKLKDSHPSVVANTVNVICELAKRNPKNFLMLAPDLFKLLTTLNNNWVLIKIVKLLGDLCPHEPRLAKKLVEPLTTIINSTPAKSLLYECLYTVTKGMHDQKSLVRLAVEKLKEFVTDSDQNLKYLGLAGLNNIMSVYPKIVSDMKDTILLCLEDDDVTIRFRALDLICGVVNKKNIKVIIQKLLKACLSAEGQYKSVLVEKILDNCSKDNYDNVGSFKWFLDVLVELTEMKGIERGDLIASQLKNVAIRVKAIRPNCIEEMLKLLNSNRFLVENLETSSMLEVMTTATWIIGEFIAEAPANIQPKEILDSLLALKTINYPPSMQSCYVQTITKIYATLANPQHHETTTTGGSGDLMSLDTVVPTSSNGASNHVQSPEAMSAIRDSIRKGLDGLLKSPDVEVQERTSTCLRILQLHEEFLESGLDIAPQISALFEEELNPVAPGSQKKVPLPEGLDLEEWINDKKEFEVEADKEFQVFEEYGSGDFDNSAGGQRGGKKGADATRKQFYLGDSKKAKLDPKIPVKNLSDLGIQPPKKRSTSGGKKPKLGELKKKPKKPKAAAKVEEPQVKPVISTIIEKPEGFDDSSGKNINKSSGDVPVDSKKARSDKLKEIDLSLPLTTEELPKMKEYKKVSKEDIILKEKESADAKKVKGSSSSDGKKKKKHVAEIENSPSITGKSSGATDGKKKAVDPKKKEVNLLSFDDDSTASSQPPQQQSSSDNISSSGKKSSGTNKSVTKEKQKRRKLCSDDHLKVTYNPKVHPLTANTIDIPIHVENISSTANVSSLHYQFTNTMNTKVLMSNNNKSQLNGSSIDVDTGLQLSPKAIGEFTLNIQFKGFEKAQQLTGSISYVLDQTINQQMKFTLKLPCSMFFLPQKTVTGEQVSAMMRNNELPFSYGNKYHYIADKQVGDFLAAVKELQGLLNCGVVSQVKDSSAILFGQSVQGHRLAVFLKGKNDIEISVEVKCNDDSIANEIQSEISHLFKKSSSDK